MTKFSFLIVTKNRAEELAFTLDKIYKMIDVNVHEVLVFIDGCETTELIKENFPWVKWFGVAKSIGASPARNMLYKNAVGTILIGLDDDAHPISNNFIEKCTTLFHDNPKLGIIAFQEVTGEFLSDSLALEKAEKEFIQFQTNNFVGCGFALKNEVYKKTNGFPLWIDIYGEEICLAIEVLDADFEILYDNSIIVNHRINKEVRNQQGKYYFRFKKQLKNTIFFYLVYRKFPLKKIFKTLFHNFNKYALKDFTYFKLFWLALFEALYNLFFVLKFRKPVKNETLQKFKNLQDLKF
ncbi:glycosyltransferase family 2 protein [Flavobacterium urocaniciphilum]|uniref:Glycosyltransferase, GT2 family n=1 Tax=Flavobacterium urocaniciphilum TaxID=1299341 RepID=A0A1H8YRW4_9FLAO|nr:glycosyltransferase [Flavobacterium urocaniciphilum]SEP54887.1 Glycosyltransferase, GT2 family [Flavobacterium urocaniciphilum]